MKSFASEAEAASNRTATFYFDVTQRPNFNNFETAKLNDTPTIKGGWGWRRGSWGVTTTR